MNTLSSFKFNSYTQIGKDEEKKIIQIVNNLIDIPEAQEFLYPVPWKQLQLDDYPEIIKNPMNLYRVQQKMKAREYNTVEQVLDHIQLIWDNCKVYNKEGHYFELAEKMQKTFKKMIKNYLPSVLYTYQIKTNNPAQNQQMTRKINQPIATHLSNRMQIQKPSIKTQQKPQPTIRNEESKSLKDESEQDEIEMEEVPSNEKNRLHQRLKLITQQELAQIVTIIQQNCPQAFKHISGDRYIIIIDNIDVDTFKKLNEKVDDFIDSDKIITNPLGSKKIKV